ncbi:MAG: RHS repeat-associated core domain-containing protein [Acidobacteria bacterium]|nr:RHS repeat-associated core domain-containing protein [Acidobacteriota bacterium]
MKSAEEKIGTSTNWKQTFDYDRFGNRTFDAANTTTISVSNTVTNPSASTSTNRLNGHTYDPAGNLTVDAENRRFVYDAENHQTKLFGPANNSETPDAIYQYDGEGRRVRKISSTETTVFVYDGSGQLVAEYTAWATADPAPAAQVSYLTADHLGSPRVVTNQNGEVIRRTDWMAFGEEVEFNKRTSGLGYDEVPETRKGYTGYEKDEESGLDFAQARYYNPKHGRFTSVDPLTASANVKNPQTFNRYSYVLNSPYKFTDPLGLIPGFVNNSGGSYCSAAASNCDFGGHLDGSWFDESAPTPDSQGVEGFNETHTGIFRYVSQSTEKMLGKAVIIDGRTAFIEINWNAAYGYYKIGDVEIDASQRRGPVEYKIVDSEGNEIKAASKDDKKLVKGQISDLKERVKKAGKAANLDNRSNCHGNTFANGEVWIAPEAISGKNADKLVQLGFRELESNETPREGDIGLYEKNGAYEHSVRYQNETTVQSKNGLNPLNSNAKAGVGPGTAWESSATLAVWTKRSRQKK